MVSKVLAPYDVVNIQVELSAEEKETYKKVRKVYTNYVRKMRIDFSYPGAWQEFMKLCARTPEGRAAMEAYRQQKSLAQASQGKIDEVWNIIQHHQGDLIIIFTNDNAMAYRLGEEFLLPVLTHRTKPKERKKMLESFRTGDIDILVTSKVLNEGVDVPEASVGIVVSGSGAVREHVQRLGRILRHKEGKRAVMYELVSKDTSETYVNKRRRMHHAYQRSPKNTTRQGKVFPKYLNPKDTELLELAEKCEPSVPAVSGFDSRSRSRASHAIFQASVFRGLSQTHRGSLRVQR